MFRLRLMGVSVVVTISVAMPGREAFDHATVGPSPYWHRQSWTQRARQALSVEPAKAVYDSRAIASVELRGRRKRKRP